MNTFVININFLSADFVSRFNLFSLTWGAKAIIDRVMAEKMKRRGYVPPTKPMGEWTVEEVEAYRAASMASDDGQTPAFDFIEMYNKVDVPIAIDQAAKTFSINGTAFSFDGMICDIVINPDRSLSVRTIQKTPGQMINTPPSGAYLLGQLYYDRSNDELYIFVFRRFQYQHVFTPVVTAVDTTNVRTLELSMSALTEVLPQVERQLTKRWALPVSPDYSTSIEQTRGVPAEWLVLESATYLNVPTKPKVVKFFLSRFYTKFDYPFRLSDFIIVQQVGCSVAESPDGAMAVTVTGPGVLEVVPKNPSRIFLGEDVVRTSDLHLRLTVI